MPILNVEFEVWCSCGEGLCNQAEVRDGYHHAIPSVVVQPCARCMDVARDEGRDEAHLEQE